MNKTRWILPFALFFCFASALPYAIDSWHYATSDSISKAEIDTHKILARYEKTKDPQEIIAWLERGPSEASGRQVHFTLAQWALQNPNNFVAIVEGLSKTRQTKFIQTFCDDLNEISLGDEFKAKFKDNESKITADIIQRLA